MTPSPDPPPGAATRPPSEHASDDPSQLVPTGASPDQTIRAAAPSKRPADRSHRRNQLPAGVTMVQVKRRFAALRVRGTSVAIRSERQGPFVPLDVRKVTRARRPWVLRLQLADGSTSYLRPFLPGEAGLLDCGSSVGGIGDSAPLGNDPVSAVIALVAIPFYVLASPLFAMANWQRTKAATRLLAELTGS